MIKAVLFDFDGVLVDAADWHFDALNNALSLFGSAISREDHLKRFNGLPTSDKLKMLTQESRLPASLHSFIGTLKQNYTRRLIEENCSQSAPISEMLEKLKAEGYRIAVVSNSLRATVEIVLKKMSIYSLFDVILCQDDVKRAKPSPEIYTRAIELLNIKTSECFAVEDSQPGMDSARAAHLSILEVKKQSDVCFNFVQEKINKMNALPQTQEKIEIVIPMAGLGTRFKQAGYGNPKPFIDVMGKPMIEWVIDNVKPTLYPSHFTFICHEEHLKNYPVKEILHRKVPDASIVTVKNTTEGAACTVLLAIENLKHSRPLLLANSDQWVDASIDTYLKDAIDSQCDGSILTFNAEDKKWSFARLDAQGKVLEVAEKKPISSHATVGIYYFKHAIDFVKGAENMILKNIRTNNEFYVCPVYNELILTGKTIKTFDIDSSQMHGLGTPEDLELFLQNRSSLAPRYQADHSAVSRRNSNSAS